MFAITSPTLGLGLLLLISHPGPAVGQAPAARQPGSDSITVQAGGRYQAGGLTRFVMGHTYRDVWATPIRVPVLDLRRFAGGLTPTKAGGGNQTKSLHFVAPDGSEYVFRLVDKPKLTVPPGFEGSVLESIARDQVSALHPAGAIAAAPLLDAAGVLHSTPILAVLPDDSLLGGFRKEFAGKLGLMEALPTKPEDAPGFAGAVAIIDSDELRALLDHDPGTRIDALAYLTARLMDDFLNDSDRHPGNWKWARMQRTPGALWVPIPRDRDNVFISYGGIVALAGKVSPKLITFGGSYPPITGLTWNGFEMDRRLLGGLERPVWDSVAKVLQSRITDQVIDAALAVMPREYQPSSPALAATLRQRRDRLPEIAGRHYLHLAAGPDIHATDAADRATVIRRDDGSVEVRLQSGNDAPWFDRRFHPSETDEIRLYLHGGDDRAVVTGNVPRSMTVRIIGGNGTNELLDSSSVGGRTRQVRFYDRGTVSDVDYGPDTVFNRRPWLRSYGGLVAPGRDRGSETSPTFGLSLRRDFGVVLRAGLRESQYDFQVRPYALRSMLTAEYATRINAWRLTASLDRRGEDTRLHFTARARMSEFEVINFYGLGNATVSEPLLTYRVHQRQWLLQPAVAFALGTRSDISLGPVLQYSTTDSTANSVNPTSHPYGFGNFGQVGLRLGLYLDGRDQVSGPHKGFLLDLSTTWYPGVWDVTSTFASLNAAAAAYYTIPVPLRPILVLRANARKLLGEFPFHESAFIGGNGSVRGQDLQRYAGDASLGGTTELQFPLRPLLPLIPFDLRVYGFADAGRVYLDGASPGGWHTGTGVGIWIGALTPSLRPASKGKHGEAAPASRPGPE